MLECVNSTCLTIVTASFEVCKTRWFIHMQLVFHWTVKAGSNKPIGTTCTVLPWHCGQVMTDDLWTGFLQLLHRCKSCISCNAMRRDQTQENSCNSSAITCRHNVMPVLEAVSGILAEGKLSNNKLATSSTRHICALVFLCWAGKQLQFYEHLRDILLITLTAIEQPSRPLWHYVELPENNRYCSLSAKSCPFIKTLPASFPSILSACLPSRNTRRVGRACMQFHWFVNNATENCQDTSQVYSSFQPGSLGMLCKFRQLTK